MNHKIRSIAAKKAKIEAASKLNRSAYGKHRTNFIGKAKLLFVCTGDVSGIGK